MGQQDNLAGRELERRAHIIMPGGWAVERERPIATLLGSCVAVALYDPVLRMGGLNHFMLPCFSRSAGRSEVDALLAGDFAMEALLNAMLACGARKDRLVAKAFGGGMVVSSLDRSQIGQRNVEFTRDWLAREGIALLASDFLGQWSRKVVLDPCTGDVFCKRAASSLAISQRIGSREQAYAETLTAPSSSGNVELF